MHNFPHQISDLDKLHRALGVIEKILNEGQTLADDQVLGVALARVGVYSFRGKLTLGQSLKKEAAKQRQNRGTETAARDLRRLFLLANLIAKEDRATSEFVLTPSGEDLLAATSGAQRQARWRAAMLGLTLDTIEDSYSHPYRLLVRLVESTPGIEKRKLLLALEADDDSQHEFDRIVDLAKLPYAQIVKKIKVSESGANNAIKILPSISQQLGDIVDKNGMCFPVATEIVTEDGASFASPQFSLVPIATLPTSVSPTDIAVIPTFGDISAGLVDLTKAIALRKKRTIEHNAAVRSLAKVFHKAKFKLYEYPYDCLAIDANQRSVLAEIKTLDGTLTDERQQAERALGQVKGYRHFSVPKSFETGPRVDLVAFTKQPARATMGFLQESGIRTVWQKGGDWRLLDKSGKEIEFEPAALF